jgi:hypothetical protein
MDRILAHIEIPDRKSLVEGLEALRKALREISSQAQVGTPARG